MLHVEQIFNIKSLRRPAAIVHILISVFRWKPVLVILLSRLEQRDRCYIHRYTGIWTELHLLYTLPLKTFYDIVSKTTGSSSHGLSKAKMRFSESETTKVTICTDYKLYFIDRCIVKYSFVSYKSVLSV